MKINDRHHRRENNMSVRNKKSLHILMNKNMSIKKLQRKTDCDANSSIHLKNKVYICICNR